MQATCGLDNITNSQQHAAKLSTEWKIDLGLISLHIIVLQNNYVREIAISSEDFNVPGGLHTAYIFQLFAAQPKDMLAVHGLEKQKSIVLV